jgi:hypothetical protein
MSENGLDLSSNIRLLIFPRTLGEKYCRATQIFEDGGKIKYIRGETLGINNCQPFFAALVQLQESIFSH